MTDPDEKKTGWGLGDSFRAFRTAGPLVGSGIQLAAAVTFFFFLGWWLDGKLGTNPWLTLVGALAGAGGGLYNFIRTAIKIGDEEDSASKTQETDDKN